jgi:NAD(P)-dependent dehydrogenase (short-subunit alcohol dehydrogenase family)
MKRRKRPGSNPPVMAVAAAPVTTADLRALKRELERRIQPAGPRRPGAGGAKAKARTSRKAAPMRWNPDPEDVQKSVAQLVLTIVEFLRQLMERQAVRRMENKTLTDKEVEAVGLALMRLEETVRDIGKRFGLTPEDLNLDLGPIKLR